MSLAELIAEYMEAKAELERLRVHYDMVYGMDYIDDQVEIVEGLARQIDNKVKELAESEVVK